MLTLDLGSLDSVARAAAEVDEKLDAVIGNAGVKAADRSARTSDGFDLMVGTNFLGHFALVAQLEPLLSPDARVVAVGSIAHRFAHLDPDTLDDPWSGPSLRQYGRSKASLMAGTTCSPLPFSSFVRLSARKKPRRRCALSGAGKRFPLFGRSTGARSRT